MLKNIKTKQWIIFSCHAIIGILIILGFWGIGTEVIIWIFHGHTAMGDGFIMMIVLFSIGIALKYWELVKVIK